MKIEVFLIEGGGEGVVGLQGDSKVKEVDCGGHWFHNPLKTWG